MKKINNEIFREHACFDDLLIISKVYLERKEWDKLTITLQDMQKTVRTLRQLEEQKAIHCHERQLKRRNIFKFWWLILGRERK